MVAEELVKLVTIQYSVKPGLMNFQKSLIRDNSIIFYQIYLRCFFQKMIYFQMIHHYYSIFFHQRVEPKPMVFQRPLVTPNVNGLARNQMFGQKPNVLAGTKCLCRNQMFWREPNVLAETKCFGCGQIPNH